MATAIRTAKGWAPLWTMLPTTRETLQPQHQGWWMKSAAARQAFEDEQVARINAAFVTPADEALELARVA